jgi:putative endonuclease
VSNQRNGTLYIGVTNNLTKRSFQHKNKSNSNSFTAKYNLDRSVYFENYQYIQDALIREK